MSHRTPFRISAALTGVVALLLLAAPPAWGQPALDPEGLPTPGLAELPESHPMPTADPGSPASEFAESADGALGENATTDPGVRPPDVPAFTSLAGDEQAQPDPGLQQSELTDSTDSGLLPPETSTVEATVPPGTEALPSMSVGADPDGLATSIVGATASDTVESEPPAPEDSELSDFVGETTIPSPTLLPSPSGTPTSLETPTPAATEGSTMTPTATASASSPPTPSSTPTGLETPTPTPTPTETSTPTPTSTSTPSPTVPLSLARAFPAGAVWINEVAWAGTLASSSDEWIELYNPGSEAIDLSGWRLT
ncbi:MAG: lamin tail domain-containing protein, partial [Anaerolineales bacterium]|nr:lamin tail domain-containing protein [Anaerolineales bacterium]